MNGTATKTEMHLHEDCGFQAPAPAEDYCHGLPDN